MATETQQLKDILTATGGDANGLPDNLTSNILTAIAQSIGEGSQGGAGIEKIEQTAASTADGGSNIITITLTDGSTVAFTVKNGSRGSTGAAGATGKPACQYAQDGGYAGTEAEVASALAAAVSGTGAEE